MLDFDAAEQRVLSTFIGNGVRFLVIGGAAVKAHGYNREVGDLDLFVEASEGNSTHLVAALRELGLTGVSPEELARSGKRIRLPRYGVEMLTSLSGVDFAEAFARKSMRTYESIEIPVLSREDLVRSKSGTGRTKDQRDIRRLARRCGLARR
jgi:hypothetical protein